MVLILLFCSLLLIEAIQIAKNKGNSYQEQENLAEFLPRSLIKKFLSLFPKTSDQPSSPLKTLVFCLLAVSCLAAQCSNSSIESPVCPTGFDLYHLNGGGTILTMTSDGSNYFICTLYGHVYCLNSSFSLQWANKNTSDCYGIYVVPS